MKAFIISVDTPQSRRQARALENQLRQQHFEPELVDGVMGKRLSTEEMTTLATPLCSWTCTPATIGIGASHIKAWKEVANRGLDAALVFEDDAHLEPDFAPALRKALDDVPSDYHVLLAGCFACSLKMPYHREHGTVSDVGMFGGSHAYVVSQQGARFLLKNNPKTSFHIDWQMWTTPGLKLYKINRDIARQNMDDSATSSMTGFPYILNDAAKFPITKNVPLQYFFNVGLYRLGTYDAHIDLAPMHALFFAAGFFNTWRVAYWLGLFTVDMAYGSWRCRRLDIADVAFKCALFGLGSALSKRIFVNKS